MSITILGIESSCDDTSASVVQGHLLLSNIIASQNVHIQYGGVVPELASRAHQQNIIPVVDAALKAAGMTTAQLDGIAFTRGPGLMGSLLVGASFAKGLSLATGCKMMEVNHLQAHILANFLTEAGKEKTPPSFPFLCLLVSGGHTQLVKVTDYLEMSIIGSTIDDAAGEALDKCAKVMGLPYPGGPVIDRNAREGDPEAYQFNKPRIQGLDYSFSGLKTSFLYFLRDKLREDPDFIAGHTNNLCASLQKTVVDILMDKLIRASQETGIHEIALAGGVSANSALRQAVTDEAKKRQWTIHLPEFKFTTDNAAMIAITGYHKYLRNEFATQDMAPLARMPF